MKLIKALQDNTVYKSIIINYSNELGKHYRTVCHTQESNLDCKASENINNAIDTFIGYLLLDAWSGNSDRHHEN
jgi:hypothetical protein